MDPIKRKLTTRRFPVLGIQHPSRKGLAGLLEESHSKASKGDATVESNCENVIVLCPPAMVVSEEVVLKEP
jgi:hypothetical protein